MLGLTSRGLTGLLAPALQRVFHGSVFLCSRQLNTVQQDPSLVVPDAATARSYGHVGFVGVGAMGAPMAMNLVKAGFSLLLYDKSCSATEKLRQQLPGSSLRIAGSPKEISETPGVTAVITMLPATDHVKEAYEGPQGLLTAQPSGWPCLFLDCSTISPTYTKDLARAVASRTTSQGPDSSKATQAQAARGSTSLFMDAPVSGGVPGALNATLTFMCGGQREALDLALPLLGSMGKRAMHMGAHQGMGQVAKLCNNLACGIEMAAVSEALALGAASGLDPRQLSQVLNTSSGRCWSSEAYNPCPGVMPSVPSSDGYKGGFSSALMLKDLRLAMELAGSCSQPVPMAESVAKLYDQLVQECRAQGGSQQKQAPILDFSAIYKVVYNGKGADEV